MKKNIRFDYYFLFYRLSFCFIYILLIANIAWRAGTYDGEWIGTTNQENKIKFVIKHF